MQRFNQDTSGGRVRYLCRRSEHAYGSKWFKVFFGSKMKSRMNEWCFARLSRGPSGNHGFNIAHQLLHSDLLSNLHSPSRQIPIDGFQALAVDPFTDDKVG